MIEAGYRNISCYVLIELETIKNSLEVLGIDFNVLKGGYAFSNCFVEDKNKSAIKLYEFYKRNPQFYFKLFLRKLWNDI